MAADLSKKHELVSDLFAEAVANSDWSKYRLSDEQVAFFNENGYLAGVKILDARRSIAFAKNSPGSSIRATTAAHSGAP